VCFVQAQKRHRESRGHYGTPAAKKKGKKAAPRPGERDAEGSTNVLGASRVKQKISWGEKTKQKQARQQQREELIQCGRFVKGKLEKRKKKKRAKSYRGKKVEARPTVAGREKKGTPAKKRALRKRKGRGRETSLEKERKPNRCLQPPDGNKEKDPTKSTLGEQGRGGGTNNPEKKKRGVSSYGTISQKDFYL